jgi:hypothetical protein
MDIRAIRAALAEVFTGEGYRVYDVLPEVGELPLVAVSWPDRVRYNTTLIGGTTIDMVVTVAVSLNDFTEAQHAIDEVMSTPGLVDRLDLGSDLWDDAVVVEAGNVRQVNVGAQALAVDLVIEINT